MELALGRRAQSFFAPKGLTIAERIARFLAMLASVWFTLGVSWGMFGVPMAGHYAAMAGTGIIGENMVHWRIGGAFWSYVLTKPTPAEYYCHHPFGSFWSAAVAYAIFGHHHWILPLPAITMSAAMPFLLYGIAKEKWGVIAASASVCGFCMLPITISFGDFHCLEVGVIFGCALFFWGHVRFMATWKYRYMMASIVGVFFATSYDWQGYIAIGVVLGWGLLRVYVLPLRWFERIRSDEYGRWWALSAAVAVASLLFIVGFFMHAEKVGDWLNSGDMRGPQGPIRIADALKARATWIDIMFTPLAITLGKIALPVAVVRVLWYRRDHEIYSLAVLVMAVIQYVVFKRGADVHIFWPHDFGLYFALAFGQLIATIVGILTYLLDTLRVRESRSFAAAAWVGAVLTLAFTIVMFPDEARALRFGRMTSGRFNNNGGLIRSEADCSWVMNWLEPHIPKEGLIDVHPSMGVNWDTGWILHRPSRTLNDPPAPGLENANHPFYLARPSGMAPELQKKMSAAAHVKIYGDTWILDEVGPKGLLEAYSLHEVEPSPFQWYFFSGVEPARHIDANPDPFLTWEWRTHLDQPADLPSIAPGTLDEIRIAYNVAISTGNAARAAEYRAKIDKQLDQRTKVEFDQGMRIIGTRVIQGVKPTLDVWFEADGPAKGDSFFAMRSAMTAKDPWSLIPFDPIERDMGFAEPLSPKLWKKGFLYVVHTPLLHRIGTEKYWGQWKARDGAPAPKRVDKEPTTMLLVTP